MDVEINLPDFYPRWFSQSPWFPKYKHMNRSHDQSIKHLSYKIYLPKPFRTYIEETFYAKVSEKAQLENLRGDPTFILNPIDHIGLYSDHGVVHVRDVATQTLEIIDRVNGTLIPERNYSQLEFIRAFGLHLAYLHDIGMVDFSEFGRFMHPEYAAQFVFSPAFDDLLELLWRENSGNIPWQLLSTFKQIKDESEIKLVFREMLALSIGHSKSKLPISIVNHPEKLYHHMHKVISTPLSILYCEQKVKKLEGKLKRAEQESKKNQLQKEIEELKAKHQQLLAEEHPQPEACRFYENFEKNAFDWLLYTDAPFRCFLADVLDSIRCIRTADALRQRGTVLRTSAGYEVFVDQNTANAIFALRSSDNQELYLLEGEKPINAGEANLASSEIDLEGNLRVSFHRGQFKTLQITKKAAYNAAVTIDDIQADTLQSFLRNPKLDEGMLTTPSKAYESIQILIEGVDDNPYFASLVLEALGQRNPGIQSRVRTTVSLQGAELKEVKRYLDGVEFSQQFSTPQEVEELIDHIAHSGVNVRALDREHAFEEVRIIHLNALETLLQSGSTSGFVYVPLSSGLVVFPLGGYENKPAPAWVPIGNTGVIRGSVRNANVFAEHALDLLIIPKEIYLDHWYTPYNAESLAEVWGRAPRQSRHRKF